jgi:hypothetical protein
MDDSTNEEALNMIIFPEFQGFDEKKKRKIKLPDETKKAGLKIVPYPTNKHKIKQRPNMENHVIPTHASAVIFNGKSGSGKTNLLVNIMSRPEFYGIDGSGKPYFDIVFLFSPTANGGDDLVRFLDIPKKRIFTEFDTTALDNIIATQKDLIEEKKDITKSPKMLIIFEDIQSDKKFMNSKSFLKCFIQCRHLNISTFLLSQSFTRTPRACRLQANNIFLFPCSRSERKLLIDEFTPPRLSKREFGDLIDHATSDDHSFLHINMREMPRTRFRKNLDEILKLQR